MPQPGLLGRTDYTIPDLCVLSLPVPTRFPQDWPWDLLWPRRDVRDIEEETSGGGPWFVTIGSLASVIVTDNVTDRAKLLHPPPGTRDPEWRQRGAEDS